MKKGKIFIISGPSGSGKTTLYRKLLAKQKSKMKLAKSISLTTREKRPREKHGRDYFFVSLKMFRYKKRNGHFLETEKLSDNYYGTPKKNVLTLMKSGKNVLLCIDVKGAGTIQRKFPRAVTIFIKTASFSDLADRLKGRGSEGKASMKLRLRRARKELQEGEKYTYVIVNDDLRKAYIALETIMKKELAL